MVTKYNKSSFMTHFQDNWTKSVPDTHNFISSLFESDHKIHRKYHKNKMNKKE